MMVKTFQQSGTTAGHGHPCVLIVEDDPLQRRAIVRLVKSWGYASLEAPDGGVAVEMILGSRDQLAAILLDIMLPVIDGVEVARRVHEEHVDVPIIACSAAFNDAIAEDLDRLGVHALLPKPYNADHLRSMLSQLIESN